MKNTGITLMILGVLFLGYSLTIDPYTNQNEYEEAYDAIEGDHMTEQYYELRDHYLTKKIRLLDYGFTSVIIGIFLFSFFYNGWQAFKILKNKLTIAIFGICAVIVTVFGYVANLFLEMHREVFHIGKIL